MRSIYDRELRLEDHADKSVRSAVQRADALCDAVMEYVLSKAESADKGWSVEKINAINAWLDATPQRIGKLLKRKPKEFVSISDSYLKRQTHLKR